MQNQNWKLEFEIWKEKIEVKFKSKLLYWNLIYEFEREGKFVSLMLIFNVGTPWQLALH